MNWFVSFPLCVASAGFIVAIVSSFEDGATPMVVFGIGISVIFSVFAMAAMEMFK